MSREAHDVLDDPVQRSLGEEIQKTLGVCDEVSFHGRQAPEVIHACAALRQGQ